MKKRKKKSGQGPERETEMVSSPVSSAAAPSAPSRSEETSSEMSDSQEPTISRMGLPMLIIPLLGILVYFADMYLMDNSGKFNAMVYYPNDDLPKPPGGDTSRVALGKIVFEKKAQCLTCHGPTGDGSKAQNAPPLAGSEWVTAEGPNRLIRIVLHGLNGPIDVKGEKWGAGAMLAWKDILTDDDIANVLSYIRQSWGNKASDVTPEQVKAIRDSESKRAVNWTSPELLQIPEK
jgi:mono/diheme cytochrome c family protein